MCPMCLATVVLVAGGVATTGGLAAVAIRKFGGRMWRKESGAGEVVTNSDHSTYSLN